MITVSISINGSTVFARTAVRRGQLDKKDKERVYTYVLDDGSTIRSRYGKGAVQLAIKMLKTIKEPGAE